MGTNYYLIENVCACCDRGDDPLHIGKSSAGWCFSLHVIPEEGINDLTDWEERWSKGGGRIVDECGAPLSPDMMRSVITVRSWGNPHVMESRWYEENHAERGPNGLARHALYPNHCIGHGEGTWDLIVGEFS